MVSKKRNRESNSAATMNTSQENASNFPGDSITQPSNPLLEFVSIKQEPIEIVSPPPKRPRKSAPKQNVRSTAVCELCLRKCPPSDLDLGKVYDAVGIQLESVGRRPFVGVCRTCWQLVQIVATFRDGCLRARDWRREGISREDGGDVSDGWLSARTSKVMEQVLTVVRSNLEFFGKEEEGGGKVEEEVQDVEPDENSFQDDDPDVKDEDYYGAEGEAEDDSKQDEYSTVTERLEITISDLPEESSSKVDTTKVELPNDLTPLPVFECTKCGRRFDSKNGLGLHTRHTEDSPNASCKNSVPLVSPHSCTVCMLYFKTRILLKGHMDKHLGRRSLACRKGCGKSFYTGATLRVHEHDCGTDRSRRLCPQCGLNFATTAHLNRHMMQVHGEANIPCKICGKQFKTRESVTRHINYSHSTENVHGCPQCGKKYKNPDSLRVHMRLHTNDMPFGCDICGKRFRYSHAVRPHMLREHGAEEEGNGTGEGATETGEDDGEHFD